MIPLALSNYKALSHDLTWPSPSWTRILKGCTKIISNPRTLSHPPHEIRSYSRNEVFYPNVEMISIWLIFKGDKNISWTPRMSWDIPWKVRPLKASNFKQKSHWKLPCSQNPGRFSVLLLPYLCLLQLPFLKICWVSSRLVWEIQSFSGTTDKSNTARQRWGKEGLFCESDVRCFSADLSKNLIG